MKPTELLKQFRDKAAWEVVALSVAVVLLALFVYLPLKGRAGRLVVDLKNLQANLDHVRSIVGPGKDLGYGKVLLEENLKKLDAKFPEKEYDALNRISELARASGLEVVAVNSQPKHLIEDPEALAIKVDGKTGQQIPVSMELRGTYGNFVGYLSALKDSPNTFTMVDHYHLRRDGSDAKTLGISVDLNLYLLL